jgi:hypothetical protein
MGLAKLSLLDTVDFGELDIFLLEAGCCLLIVGSECFAVSTPKHEVWLLNTRKS